MTKISTAEARNDFADVINRTSFGKERFILTRRGKVARTQRLWPRALTYPLFTLPSAHLPTNADLVGLL